MFASYSNLYAKYVALRHTDFSSFATRIKLPSNYILVSFDVVSLFTNIPVNGEKEIAHKHLLADTTLEDCTMYPPAEVSRLLEFCFNVTYLAYREAYYQPTYGTAMSSPHQ